MVLYKLVMGKFAPKVDEDFSKYAHVVVKTQSLARGFLARRRVARLQ